MKNIIRIILIVIVLVGAWFLFFKNDDTTSTTETEVETTTLTPGETASISGTITALNSDQIAFDGPHIVTVETDDNVVATILVPSMGLPLCAASKAGNIADVSTLQRGDKIEAKGRVSEEGGIVPCDSADYYLRVK